jgi:cytochrome c oxidase cbb3-type subunit I/II
MMDPSSMSPGSIMPSYIWLFDHELDTSRTESMIHAMRKLGVPYPDGYAIEQANKDLAAQEKSIRSSLQADKVRTGSNKEIVALIAYLQRLGKDLKASETTSPQGNHKTLAGDGVNSSQLGPGQQKSAPKEQTAMKDADGRDVMGN